MKSEVSNPNSERRMSLLTSAATARNKSSILHAALAKFWFSNEQRVAAMAAAETTWADAPGNASKGKSLWQQ